MQTYIRRHGGIFLLPKLIPPPERKKNQVAEL
jgi:hypothetical protein